MGTVGLANKGSDDFALPCYVRVKKIIREQFVEFDFAVGDPSLYVELILPQKAFEEFCTHNRVIHMTDEQAGDVDKDMKKWRYGVREY
jgi:phenol/toluene 2-monooxygenase (NADH) P0/A0